MAKDPICIEVDGEEIELPTTNEICRTCDGEGKHVNPNIDGHGITSEEWERDWDDESREAYFSGRYDVRCDDCDGRGVVRAPDPKKMTPELRKAWREWQREEAEYRAECAAERRFGC